MADGGGMEEDEFEERAALLGTRVRVALADGTSARGLLVGADPETRHVALAQPADVGGRVRLQLLLPSHVRGVIADEDEDEDADALLRSLVAADADAAGVEPRLDADERMARLKVFLDKHFVPFEAAEDGALRLFGGAATLLPPFADANESVASENEQLAGRLRTLVAAFSAQA